MSWNGKNEALGDAEELGFELTVDGHTVPGVYWKPKGGSDRLVLLGHGGTAHKKAEYIVSIASMLTSRGIAAMAIDGPGHGDRKTGDGSEGLDDFAKVWTSNGGTQTVLADWKAALDFIEAQEGARPTGWWGLSMGTMMGLPVCATEPRISIALLGLMGTWGPNGDDLIAHAPNLQCPVRFLVQWDDEIVPKDKAFELFGMLGSERKTMVVNPGKHSDVPIPDFEGSVEYLDRYLARN